METATLPISLTGGSTVLLGRTAVHRSRAWSERLTHPSSSEDNSEEEEIGSRPKEVEYTAPRARAIYKPQDREEASEEKLTTFAAIKPAPSPLGLDVELPSVLYGKSEGAGMGTAFVTTVFELSVGPEKVRMTAHQGALSQSPVLRRMCSGPFLEASTKHINLPEDDPEVFTRLLSFLYGGDFAPLNEHFHKKTISLLAVGSLWDISQLLANVYIAADKYDIDDLKELIVLKYSRLHPFLAPEIALEAAQRIYFGVPDQDRKFRDYFCVQLPELVDSPTINSSDHLEHYLHGGGNLATDLFRAQTKRLQEADAAAAAITETAAKKITDTLIPDFEHFVTCHLSCLYNNCAGRALALPNARDLVVLLQDFKSNMKQKH